MARTRSMWLAVVMVMATAALAAPGAQAAEDGKGAGPRGHTGSRFQQWLGLTDDQMKSIREIQQRHAEEGRQLRQALYQARVDLHQLALNGGDEGALKTKTEEVEKLLGQTVELRVKTLREIGPLLTPEQREKFARIPSEGGWHGRGRPARRS